MDGTTVYDAKEEAEKAQQGQGEPQGEPAAPLSTLNKPLLEHGLIEYRPSSRGPFTTCATLHRIPTRGTISPGRGVLHYLEIIMSNIQIVDLPALPEVEEVSLSDVEDELLLAVSSATSPGCS